MALCVLLIATSAAAHGAVGFDFTWPLGVGNASDGGVATLRWSDDGADDTTFTLWVSRAAVPPLLETDLPPSGMEKISGTLTSLDTADAFAWDVSAVAPGCYQPFVLLEDLGVTYLRTAKGKVTVAGSGSAPPAIWLDHALEESTVTGGHFDIRVLVSDPEDSSTVTLKYGAGRRPSSLEVIADSLRAPDGGGAFTHRFDTSALPNGEYALLAEVSADGGRSCATYLPFTLYVINSADGGTDGGRGTDAGAPDGGGAGREKKTPTVPEVGCAVGWSSSFGLLALVLLARGRRR